MPILREIVEEGFVSQEIDRLEAEYERLEDVFLALKWRLARQPEIGVRVTITNPVLYLIKTDPDPTLNIPGVLLLYSYNDVQVNIINIRVDDPET